MRLRVLNGDTRSIKVLEQELVLVHQQIKDEHKKPEEKRNMRPLIDKEFDLQCRIRLHQQEQAYYKSRKPVKEQE